MASDCAAVEFREGRYFPGATADGDAAARPIDATLFGACFGKSVWFTHQLPGAPPRARVGDRDRGKQGFGIRVCWPREDGIYETMFDDAPKVDHRDSLSHMRHD